MFRSVSQDANTMAVDENDHGNIPMARRRTRAQALQERRDRHIRTRENMEAMTGKRQPAATTQACGKSTPPPCTPPRTKKASPIAVGASFGKDLVVEHTPPRGGNGAQSAMQKALEKQALAQPTADTSDASAMHDVESTRRVATRASRLLPARGIAQSSSSGGRKRMISFSPERTERPINEAAERQKRQRNIKATEKLQLRLDGGPLRTPEKPKLARSSLHTTPTMVAKSPQVTMRTPSPSQQHQQQKRSTPTLAKSPQGMRTPSPSQPQHKRTTPTLAKSPLATPMLARTKSPQATPTLAKSPQVPSTQQQKKSASPTTASERSEPNQVAVAPSPTLGLQQYFQQPASILSESPESGDSVRTMVLPSGDEDEMDEDRAPSRLSSSANVNATTVSCKKELDFTMAEILNDSEIKTTQEAAENETKLQHDEALELSSQELLQDGEGDGDQGLSQASQEEDAAMEAPVEAEHSTTIDFSEPFTSTSTIEDVGLFNCELDVEFTGGVYGEGTDGKVSAAMVRGQKVALKRAKPHDGFPEEEAKRRSAVELHYLRRVRHVPGFVQCLGLCDGIEHTCIALEVMDCKLSDYLRRYGHQKKKPSSSSSSRKSRCFTLSLDATKAMLRQICLPMRELHDTVNVAHGDLACRNILLRLPPNGYEQKWEPVVKLSDFGRIKTPASEPPIFDDGFSFSKNCDVGAFAREILYRLLVGEIVPTNCTETRTLHKHLQDVVVVRIPERAKEKLGPYYRLFMRCAGWGVRPTFQEMVDHLDDLEYFETSDNGYFPLKPTASSLSSSQETASFLSPVGDDRVRGHSSKAAAAIPSSGSKNKYETPTTANPRGLPTTAPGNSTGTVTRLLQPTKSFTEGPSNVHKTVNWLKARSVHPGGGGQVGPPLPTKRPGSSMAAAMATPSTHPQPVHSTPNNGRPTKIAKKTPPSAGASRRSLQIINHFQHRLQHEKEKKKC